MRERTIFLISGESGAGKDSLISAVLKWQPTKFAGMPYLTSREPRKFPSRSEMLDLLTKVLDVFKNRENENFETLYNEHKDLFLEPYLLLPNSLNNDSKFFRIITDHLENMIKLLKNEKIDYHDILSLMHENDFDRNFLPLNTEYPYSKWVHEKDLNIALNLDDVVELIKRPNVSWSGKTEQTVYFYLKSSLENILENNQIPLINALPQNWAQLEAYANKNGLHVVKIAIKAPEALRKARMIGVRKERTAQVEARLAQDRQSYPENWDKLYNVNIIIDGSKNIDEMLAEFKDKISDYVVIPEEKLKHKMKQLENL